MHRAIVSTCKSLNHFAASLTESEKRKFLHPADNRVGKVTALPAMLQKEMSRADFCAGSWMEEMDYQVINHPKKLAGARTHEQGDSWHEYCHLHMRSSSLYT